MLCTEGSVNLPRFSSPSVKGAPSLLLYLSLLNQGRQRQSVAGNRGSPSEPSANPSMLCCSPQLGHIAHPLCSGGLNSGLVALLSVPLQLTCLQRYASDSCFPQDRGAELLPLTPRRGCLCCLSDSQPFITLRDGEHPHFIARTAEVLIRVPQEPHKSQGWPGYLTVPQALLPSSTPGGFSVIGLLCPPGHTQEASTSWFPGPSTSPLKPCRKMSPHPPEGSSSESLCGDFHSSKDTTPTFHTCKYDLAPS